MLSWLLDTFKNYFNGDSNEKKEDILSRLPTHLNEKIVGKLDILSRLMLRKASGPFRELVDKKDLAINELSIKYNINSIEVTVDGGFHVQYQDVGRGTLAKCDNQMRLLKGDNFVELFKRDLYTILSSKKLTINTLKIVNFRELTVRGFELEEAIVNIEEKVIDVFNDLKKKLKVENLVVTTLLPDQIKKIMVHIDPNSIRSVKFGRLKFEVPRRFYIENYVFDFPDAFDEDQLKNLEVFQSEQPVEAINLVKLAHCQLVNVRLSIYDFVSMEQFEELMKQLYTNVNLIQMKIRGTSCQSISNFLKLPYFNRDMPRFWTDFKNPIFPKEKLSICMFSCSYGPELLFKGPKFVEEPSTEDEEKLFESGDDYELDYY